MSSAEVHGLDFVLENFFLQRQQQLGAGPTTTVSGYKVPAGPNIDVERWVAESAVLVALAWAKSHDVNVSIHKYICIYVSAVVFIRLWFAMT